MLIAAGVLLLVNYLMPVITVIVCMVIQARILFLRSSEIQDPIDRRAAITILLVSTILFTLHFANSSLTFKKIQLIMADFLSVFGETGTRVDAYHGDRYEDLYKGLFYELSPLMINLAILVILQNFVVAWDNFKRRENSAPWLLASISVGDLLFAHGGFLFFP